MFHAPQYVGMYRLPSAKPIPFDKIFRYEDRGTEMTLQTLSQKRNDLMQWLKKPTSSEAGIELVKQYLPHLLGLITSIQSNTELRTYTPLSMSIVVGFGFLKRAMLMGRMRSVLLDQQHGR
jgi:hypothetical protein